MKPFAIIVAVDENRGIGKAGKLPWHLPSDLKHFSKLTTGGTVIMGRKTWESLPDKYRPLPGRLNIVMSRSPQLSESLPDGVFAAHSLSESVEKAGTAQPTKSIFLIGGGELFQQALHHPECQRLFVTEVMGDFECDTFFPEIEPSVYTRVKTSETFEENGLHFQFVEYARRG